MEANTRKRNSIPTMINKDGREEENVRGLTRKEMKTVEDGSDTDKRKRKAKGRK